MINNKCPMCKLPNLGNHWLDVKNQYVCVDCYNGKTKEQIISQRKRDSNKFIIKKEYYEKENSND